MFYRRSKKNQEVISAIQNLENVLDELRSIELDFEENKQNIAYSEIQYGNIFSGGQPSIEQALLAIKDAKKKLALAQQIFQKL